MVKMRYLLFGFLVAAAVQPAAAAKRLGPPVEELQSVPDRIRIVIAEVREKPEPGKIVFSVKTPLTGDSPDEVTLRLDEDSFDDTTVGQSHIVAWTDKRRNRRVIGGWEKDPDGPYVVRLLGLGSTALFEDNPDTRLLFSPGTITDPNAGASLTDALLAQMQREEQRSRGLVIMEFWLRKDLTAEMTAEQVNLFADAVRDSAVPPQQRELLFQTALQLPPENTSPWLAEELRKTIIWHGTQYDLRSFVPALVRTAARSLGQVGTAEDIELLDTLLYSNNPGVSKAALGAMDQLDRETAIARAQRALERGWIHNETRLALRRYLGW